MKAFKIIVVVLLVYAGIVTSFETMIGTLQPAAGKTLVITTFGTDRSPHDRVLARLDTDGHVYVSANHWPRAWYRTALANPDVQATMDGAKKDYRAVPVSGAEAARVESEHPHSLVFRILTGFPPRYFLRLDPREPASASQ